MLLSSCLSALLAAASCSAASIYQRASPVVNQTTCDGKQFTYESLAGYGFIPSNARDKYGDTIGGIGSSIALDRSTWKKSKGSSYTGILWALPDRGWNTQGTLNYQNRIQKLSLTFTPAPTASLASPSPPNLKLTYLDTILLTGPDGAPVTGLDADVTGSLSYPGFPPLPAATFVGNGFGQPGPGGKRIAMDTEGLVLARDGTFWISDEYGPYIYHFSKKGKMISAIQPPDAYLPRRNGSVSFSANSPPIYAPNQKPVPADTESGRNNNQGLEGLTVSEDGKTLYALMQSALDQEGGPNNPYRKQARLLVYDISNANKPTYEKEFVVTLPLWTDPTAKASKALKVAAQSEIHSLGSGQFFVLARDSGAGHGADSSLSIYRHVDIFDISGSSGATDIKSRENDAATGSIADKMGNLEEGVRAAEYCQFLDFNVNGELGKFGLHNGGAQDAGLLNEKWEGLALAPVDGKDGKDGEYFLISLSDNDFITQDGHLNFGNYNYSDASGYNIDNQALVFQVKLPTSARPS